MNAEFECNNTDATMGNSMEEYYNYSEHYSQRKLIQVIMIQPIWIAKMDNTFSKNCCKGNEQIWWQCCKAQLFWKRTHAKMKQVLKGELPCQLAIFMLNFIKPYIPSKYIN